VSSFRAPDGVEIVYERWGDGDGSPAAPPVVLHHGFAADSEKNWVDTGVVRALVAAGRAVVTLDARGHGRSGKPHDPALYGEATMARDLSLLVDEIGVDRVDLVGYSMGGIVALLAATRERRIRRLVVGGIGAGVVELGGLDTRALPTRLVAEALRTGDPATIVDPMAAAFRAFAESTGADRWALAAQAEAVHAAPIPLERITVPTLVLAGDDDPLAVRPDVLADAVAGAELRLVPGDHLMAVVEPTFAPTIVAFLAEP
jgi:pimeloyl-ACP methyl ester carboxylesterase